MLVKTVSRVVSARAIPRWHMGLRNDLHNETVAACDGGGRPHGHPRVFLNLGPDGKVECPYCSRLFVNRAMQRSAAGDATTPPKPTPGATPGAAEGVSEERNL
jgi:uncharacterized Zn-finger protein